MIEDVKVTSVPMSYEILSKKIKWVIEDQNSQKHKKAATKPKIISGGRD